MSQRQMDLPTVLRVLRRRWWLLVLAVLVGAVPTYLVSRALPKVYEAHTTLLVGLGLPGTSPDYQQLLASQQLSQTYASLATTGPVLQAVRSTLGLDTDVEELRASVKATAPIDSSLITITASNNDPARAAQIADGLAQELISRSPAISSKDPAVEQIVTDLLNGSLQNLQRQISVSETEITRLAELSSPTPEEDRQLAALRDQLPDLQQAYATVVGYVSGDGTNILTVVDPAQVPTEPTGPRVLLNTLIVTLLVLANAIALAFLLEYLDDTLKSPEDVEALAGLPTLGAITRMRLGHGRNPKYGLATMRNPRSAAAEAYRTLRTNIDFANADDPIPAILVTSAVRNEGRTTTAANLAVAIAQTGSNTLLLDADLRHPGVHRMFDLPNDEGLTSVLGADGAPVERVLQATEQPNLRVITTGPIPAGPVDVLASRRMGRLLGALREQVDVIVIDSPPLEASSDATFLSTLVDGTLLVVSAGHTRRTAVRGAVKTLAARGGRTLGVVLNGVSRRDEHDEYAYGHDHHPHPAGPKEEVAAAVSTDDPPAWGNAKGAVRRNRSVIGQSPGDSRP